MTADHRRAGWWWVATLVLVPVVLAGRRQWSVERAHRVTERSAEDARRSAGGPDRAVFAEGATFTGTEFARSPVIEPVRAGAPLVDLPG